VKNVAFGMARKWVIEDELRQTCPTRDQQMEVSSSDEQPKVIIGSVCSHPIVRPITTVMKQSSSSSI
jgi:hypothetical protein